MSITGKSSICSYTNSDILDQVIDIIGFIYYKCHQKNPL
jgi:hypothetical protein